MPPPALRVRETDCLLFRLRDLGLSGSPLKALRALMIDGPPLSNPLLVTRTGPRQRCRIAATGTLRVGFHERFPVSLDGRHSPQVDSRTTPERTRGLDTKPSRRWSTGFLSRGPSDPVVSRFRLFFQPRAPAPGAPLSNFDTPWIHPPKAAETAASRHRAANVRTVRIATGTVIEIGVKVREISRVAVDGLINAEGKGQMQ